MRLPVIGTLLLLLVPPAASASSDWPDATPTAWHQLARAESLLTAPEPPNPVAVCVVDSGVNLTPDLAPAVIERLAYDGGDPGDTYPQEGIDDGHGTYVATFLAGQVNGWGGAGLWPRAKIVSVRVFPPGGVRASVYDYVDAMRACRQHAAVRVINLSLGNLDGTSQEFGELENTIAEYRLAEDINVVAAAGNRGGQVEVPARYPPAFAVGGTTPSGELCSISARGEGLDVLAPGCDLQGSDQQGRPAAFTGTSFSAPLVSALLAALRSYAGVTADQAEQIVLRSGREGAGGVQVDVAEALRLAGIEWSSHPQSAQPAAPEPKSPAVAPSYKDLAAPRATVLWGRGRLLIRLRNRPDGAMTEVRVRRKERQMQGTTLRIRVRRPPAVLGLRYIDDDGTSEWKRFRVRKRTGG